MISQLMFINKLLSTKNYDLVALNSIDESYFSQYKAEFTFIKNHYTQYHTVPDTLTFVNVFPDFDITEVTEPDNYILDELRNTYYNECAVKLFNEAKRNIESGKAGKDTFLKLKNIINDMEPQDSLTCVDLIHDTGRFERYLDRTKNQNTYLSTGFTELDEIIGGIDCENENMVLASRTGVGKTMTMLKIATAAYLQGKNVGVYEGEMTEDKVGYRVDSLLSNGQVSNKGINRGYIDSQYAYTKYMDKLTTSTKGCLKILTPMSCGGKVTVNTLRSFVIKEHLDILFVDQYSLLDDTGYAKTSFERVGNIAKEIKQLQVEFRIPVIAVSQMNRTKNEDGSQDTTQIGLSDMIPQYATTLIMLDKKPMPNADNNAYILTLNIVKARDGGDNKKVSYRVDFDRGLFEFIPEAQGDEVTNRQAQELEDRYTEPFYTDANIF